PLHEDSRMNTMINQPQRLRRRHESYDEKCERWHRMRESLRQQHNMTVCRFMGMRAPDPLQSPRQREFLRRRNLGGDAGRAPPGQRIHRDPTEGSILLQAWPQVPFVPQESSEQFPSSGAAGVRAADPYDFPGFLGISLMLFTRSLQVQTWPQVSLPFLTAHSADADSSCSLIPAPMELPHIPPCTLPARPQHPQARCEHPR
uniref:Uncharacterized protein n=1 Tax=Melopsittacus undulatus TaxID=13146 RepID=A0A8C6NBA7_MELUD